MANRILENDLKLPALYFIKERNGEITTTELSEKLREFFKPSGDDVRILSGRGDDYFSQIVRNLTGYQRSFVQQGYIDRSQQRNSPLSITDIGQKYLEQNGEGLQVTIDEFGIDNVVESLRVIDQNQDKGKLLFFDENAVVKEGAKIEKKGQIYERSSSLRNYAIEHFTNKDGRISCDCCSINFGDFYGDDIGKGLIDIHHVKPIFKFEKEDMEAKLKEAVKNLIPVCPNCHRVIHRNWKKPLDIPFLQDSIRKNGIFNKQEIKY